MKIIYIIIAASLFAVGIIQVFIVAVFNYHYLYCNNRLIIGITIPLH